ncbi:hypothetical protein PG997_010429 [Apiospora hydei]|uniref:Uncharacterized protein n=1 Tax=Apiospora hydei TaxID=1337664 RepID=A0ABR1VWY1_9PEZI
MASSPQPGEKRKAEEISSDAPLDNIINIDPDGDLVLVVGADLVGSATSFFSVEKAVAFRADHRALMRASPVLKTKFDPKSDNHKPGTSEAGWTEHLPDGSPTGMKFLLLVAHAELSQVPVGQTFQEVYEIVSMAKRLQMLSLLKIRAKSWVTGDFPVAPLQFPLTSGTDAKTLIQAFWIGRGLGDEVLLTRVVNHVTNNSTIMNGHLHINGTDLESLDTRFSETSMGNNKKHEKLCERLALGSLLQQLGELNWWPLPDPENMSSVVTVDRQLGQIILSGFSETIPERLQKYHCDWTSNLKKQLASAKYQTVNFTGTFKEENLRNAALVGLSD